MYESGAKVVASSDAGSTATRIDEFAPLLDFLVNRLEIPAATASFYMVSVLGGQCDMSPFKEALLSGLEEYLQGLQVAIEGLTTAEIHWQPTKHTNHIKTGCSGGH